MTKNQKDLLNHITKKNNEIEAWVNEDPKNRWAGLITTDLDHWASYGIYDVAEYEGYISANTLYEVYSDKYSKGYARGMDFFSMSQEKLDELWTEIEEEEKKKEERRNLQEAENLVNNKILAESLGVTIEDLERWEVAY